MPRPLTSNIVSATSIISHFALRISQFSLLQQTWVIPTATGLYLFQVQHSEKYLELDGSKTANHTKVQQLYREIQCLELLLDRLTLEQGRT
jgi:hypothetical protein